MLCRGILHLLVLSIHLVRSEYIDTGDVRGGDDQVKYLMIKILVLLLYMKI